MKAIEVVKTKLGEFDTSGRRRPVPTDEVVRVDCDTVILAVGEKVDPDFTKASGLKVKESGTVEVDRYSMETSRERFYAGGDLVTGASNVSRAMRYGRQAARKIDKRLMGVKRVDSLWPPFEYAMEPPEKQSESPRQVPGEIAPAERVKSSVEVSLGLTPRRPWKRRHGACGATSATRTTEGGPGLTQKLKVRIDGEFVAASPGQSVLQVARAASKYIPALCYMEGLTAVGACRLCMVEVQGVSRLLPACTTPAQDGMAVTTTSPQLKPTAGSRSSSSSVSGTTCARCACRAGTASCRPSPRSTG